LITPKKSNTSCEKADEKDSENDKDDDDPKKKIIGFVSHLFKNGNYTL
jgi:hypothetical protein